jgi:hypothetical protein
MSPAPRPSYQTEQTESLADLREHLSHVPDALCLEPAELANRLGHPAVDIAAALEALTIEGEVLP